MEHTVQPSGVSGLGGSEAALEAKTKLTSSFRRRGVFTATMSGVSYGTYTAFMTLAMTMGVWGVWYGGDRGFRIFPSCFFWGRWARPLLTPAALFGLCLLP